MSENGASETQRNGLSTGTRPEDYLFSTADNQVLSGLSKMGQHLKELKLKMLKAEAEYDAAKKEYEYYSSVILPTEMLNAGVSRVDLADGGVMSYERKWYISPNKNEKDKATIAEWLRAHDGEHLIKERAAVDKAQFDKLKASGIPYVEVSDFNSNSLKAFLKDKIGASGGMAQLQITDIPPEIHFQELGTVNIEV
jgi:hypothetical protein